MAAFTALDRQASHSVSVTCDDEGGVFLISSGGGFSCYGYENCHNESVQIANAIGRPELAPTDAQFGTLRAYHLHGELLRMAAQSQLGTLYDYGTPPKVQALIEGLIGRPARVRITYGDPETGRAFDDRPETGTVGRTGGTLRKPLLIKTARSHGGGTISTASIVRLEVEGRDAYRHPRFHEAQAQLEAPTEMERLPSPGM